MKKILSIILAAFTAFSCSWIDLGPTSQLSPDQIWSGDETTLDGYVFGLYAAIRDKAEIYSRNNFTDAYTDLIKSGSWDQYGHTYNSISMEPSVITSDDASSFEIWEDSYVRIKRDNEFLRDAVKYAGNFSSGFLRTRIAEIKFIRAVSYFYLIRVYAGVVIRDESAGVDGPDQNNKARLSEADSWAWVIDNLRAAAADLPEAWDSKNYGRATKAAAWGMASRCAVYKIWALKNSGASASAVAEACSEAIAAADSCKAHGAALAPDYSTVFSSEINSENLFTVTFFRGSTSQNLSHEADRFFRPKGDQKTHGGATVSATFGPTAELADSYEMADGTPFDWAVHGANPWTGREPRFYASILYNDAKWEDRRLKMYTDPDDPDGVYDGFGTFRKSGSAECSVTGYYLRKWITEDDNSWATNGSSHFWILIRYAEVLLNKAEAQAIGGDLPGALASLGEVRSRVGLPAAAAADLSEFMKVLEHERVVELAGEGFRYWDLRRWRRAFAVLNDSSVHGCKPTPNGDGTYSYSRIDADGGYTRIFKEQYYAFSIPVSERSANTLLGDNNPGW